MTEATLAERRFYLLYPTERSWKQEVLACFHAYLTECRLVQELGPRKSFFHIIERRKLADILARWGVPMDDPDDTIAYILELQRALQDSAGGTTVLSGIPTSDTKEVSHG